MLKKDSAPVFVIGLALTLALVIPVLYEHGDSFCVRCFPLAQRLARVRAPQEKR
jgi:hypothetical protein